MRTQRGASLIDTIVGVSLMLLVFVGISGAFQLSIELVSNNKARIGAAALAQEQMEYIRSLSYDSMGIQGGIPAGNVPQVETISLNGVSYTRDTLIRYIDDPKDGSGGADTNGIIADSKEIKVAVSWNSSNGVRTISLASRASPVGIEQTVIGGTILIAVNDAASQPVMGASVRIVNASTSPPIDVTSLTDIDGTTAFIGAPQASGYQITVTKSGYSSDQTYSATAQLPNPNPGHLSVTNYLTTAQTFRIDFLAQKTVRTYKAIEEVVWQDAFADETKVALTSDTVVSGGEVHLTDPAPYPSTGEIQSVYLGPSYLSRWKEISWVDDEPAGTSIRYQVYYQDGASPSPVPDAVLPGNSGGFTVSPVDISGIPVIGYPSVRLRALLSTTDDSVTPSIQSWSITYDNGPEPLGNIAFMMRGNKVKGTDGSGAAVHKYNQALTTDALGVLSLNNMEEDTYTITIDDAAIGYDIAESCEPQPRALLPGGSVETKLYFAPNTANSILFDVRSNTGVIIPNATVRLFRAAPAYDQTQTTGTCGQTFYPGMSAGTVGAGNAYSVEVTAAGYQPYTSLDIVEVTGQSRLSIPLNAL